MNRVDAQLHELEREFGLPAREILDVINRRNRCKIAVRCTPRGPDSPIASASCQPFLRGTRSSRPAR
jgi:hypothetical protein